MPRSDAGSRRHRPETSPKRNVRVGREKTDPATRTRLAVHFSSKTTVWETPQDLFEKLNSEFGFTLDVCASPENAKCERFFTPATNGLKERWEGVCWCNPPYGREIGQWVKKAHEASLHGATVVCLLPARTDTSWWHAYVLEANEIRFVQGRLRFVGARSSAPFPSVVVVFRPWFSATLMRSAA